MKQSLRKPNLGRMFSKLLGKISGQTPAPYRNVWQPHVSPQASAGQVRSVDVLTELARPELLNHCKQTTGIIIGY